MTKPLSSSSSGIPPNFIEDSAFFIQGFQTPNRCRRLSVVMYYFDIDFSDLFYLLTFLTLGHLIKQISHKSGKEVLDTARITLNKHLNSFILIGKRYSFISSYIFYTLSLLQYKFQRCIC